MLREATDFADWSLKIGQGKLDSSEDDENCSTVFRTTTTQIIVLGKIYFMAHWTH